MARIKKILFDNRTLAFVLLVILTAIRVADPAPVEMLRLKTFDLYQNFKPRTVSESQVTIIDIDEKSLVL